METYLIISLIFFLTIAIFRLNWALFIVLCALPTYLIRFSLFSVPSTLLEVMILIVFIVWFFKDKPWQRFKKSNWSKKRQKYPYYFEIIGILIAAFLGLIIANFNFSAFGIFKAYFLEPIMLYIVIINQSAKGFKKFIWPLILSALLVSIVAIFQQFSEPITLNNLWTQIKSIKVSSVFQYPNAVGLYLGPIIMLAFGLFLSYPKRSSLIESSQKLILLLTVFLSSLAIFFAQSEGALAALIIAFLSIAFLANKKSRKVAVIILIIGTIFLSLHPPSFKYIKTRATLMDLSGQIRQQQWQETIAMLKDGRLLTGAGLANYQTALAPYHQEGIFVKDINDPDWHRKVVWDKDYHKQAWQPVEIYLYPHNILLNFWTEITILGALLFLWLIARALFELIFLLKNLRYKQKSLALGVIGALIVIFVHGLVDVPYFKNDLAVLFWLIIAFAGIIKLRNKKGI